MPVLVDFQQVLVSNVILQLDPKQKNQPGTENKSPVDLCRHIVANQLKKIRNKFPASTYGEMILCLDGANPWRLESFPNYKACRKTQRQKSDKDWTQIHTIMDILKKEVKTNYPYPVIRVDRCEADDIIAVMTKKIKAQDPDANIAIISSDKDFYQLQKYSNVVQYSPVHHKMVKPDIHPANYLIRHILSGDAGDGIPNVLSDDDTFVIEEKRQNTLTKKRLTSLLESQTCANFDTDSIHKNIQRNLRLINLIDIDKYIPNDLHQTIINKYTEQKVIKDRIGRSRLIEYFTKNHMNLLITYIGDF